MLITDTMHSHTYVCIYISRPTSVGNSICTVSSGNLEKVDACHLLVVISSWHSYIQSRNQEPSWVLLQSFFKIVIFPKTSFRCGCWWLASFAWDWEPDYIGLWIENREMQACHSMLKFQVEHCWHGIMTCLFHDPWVSSSRVPNKSSYLKKLDKCLPLETP